MSDICSLITFCGTNYQIFFFFPLLPCGGPSHLVASSTFIVNALHLLLSSVVVFHSWLFVPALSRSRLTLSFHHSFGLPLLLLPPSSAFHALFSLSSPILCTCPAHLILLPATFIFRCFFMPIFSLKLPNISTKN